jgi:protoporphyrinogen oxidase
VPESNDHPTIDASNIVIIGAGPAGLTAAWELIKKDVTPIVIEADDQVGGISRTVERDGWRFDIGGHRFFTKVARVQSFWHEVLGDDDFLTRDRLSRIYYGGQFYDYPIKPLNALANLGPIESVRCVASYVWTKLRPPKDQADFESWVAARFGWRLYRIFFKTYTEKVWGVPATEIRSDWAAQRIKGLSLPSAVLNAFRMSYTQTKHTSLIDRFEYPRLGPGMMWERTSELVQRADGEVRLNTRVESLLRDQHGVVIAVIHGDRGRETIEVDHVISSMPLGELALAMSPPPPEAVVNAAKSLSHRDFLTVALVVPESSSFSDNWIYVHDPTVKLGRVQNFRSWSPDMVKPGRTCLGLEYFVFEGDELWGMADDDLIAFATEEITRIALIDAGVVEAGFVVRVPQAYPVYDADYADHIEVIRTWLSSDVPNVHPVGRNGMHRYNNQDHSMLTAMLAVENIFGADHDVWTVNVEAEYHESGHHRGVTPQQSKILDGVSGTGRDVPRLLERGPLDDSAPRGVLGVLAGLSRRHAFIRDGFRFGFRTMLNVRRRARAIARSLAPATLFDHPNVHRISWRVYRLAFSISHVGWLRQLHFRVRDRLTRNRSQVVSVDRLLVGGWNGMSGRRFAEKTGLLLDPSTRLADSAQVDLLRRYDADPDTMDNYQALKETEYFKRIRLASSISGHHRGASSDEELAQLAREFLDRYRGKEIPYRPGRSHASVAPRVRRIDRSDCFEIRDGHHRLAIELVRGARELEVLVERPTSVTPVQHLLRRMSWLDGQERLYQPVALPEVAEWPLMRRCTDRLSMMLNFLEKTGRSPDSGDRSYLDVGACYGWFVEQMQSRGFDSSGIEQDPLSRTLAPLIYRLDPERLHIGDAVELLERQSTTTDIVSCFSMLHHFVLGRSTSTAEELIALLDKVTGDVLFLDTGQSHETWFRLVLPEWTTDYIERWILANTTFTSVRALGTDQDDVAPFAGKYGRTLFACTR